MIYLRLAGGLGNQLFQLAAAYEVQNKTGQSILIATTGLAAYSSKREPSVFNFIDFYGEKEIDYTDGNYSFILKLLNFRLGRFPFFFSINSKTINSIGISNFYLIDGYFQDLRSIRNGLEKVKKLIIKKRETEEKLKNLYCQITDGYTRDEICAIHIRRGDYTDKKNQKIYTQQDASYYFNAIKIIKFSIKRIVIFSDESNVSFDFFSNYDVIYVSAFNLRDYEEIILMSYFLNIVIANSTFSFWSAIVNGCDSKEMLAPQKWSYIEKEDNIWNYNLDIEGFKRV